MRQLETIQTKEKLNQLYAADDKGVGGAPHEYVIVHARHDEEVPAHIQEINFQKGHRNDPEARSGVIDSDLLEIVRDRLKGFQEGEFATDDNARALVHVEEALRFMNKRVEDRINRDVLGSYNK